MKVISDNSIQFSYYLFAGTTATRSLTEKAQKRKENKQIQTTNLNTQKGVRVQLQCDGTR